MSMKDLGREERGKKGAMSRQWREIGLLTKGTGPADVRAATCRREGGSEYTVYSVGHFQGMWVGSDMISECSQQS